MSIDTKKFEAAMKNNPDRVKSVLSGSDGLSTRLEKISAQATSKPIANFNDLIVSNDNNTLNQLQIKPMDQLAMQKYAMQGILFDSLT